MEEEKKNVPDNGRRHFPPTISFRTQLTEKTIFTDHRRTNVWEVNVPKDSDAVM